ncbi:glycosyltransferase [Actinomadura sp. NEAU-AAG5]|uniref:Glycosyltransferase n=1 Tax=Actinomadura litoris TaxID=2678616 RepID=A0A7K1L9L7_9ACTN|nr:glycosyltransferase [Actinomadura litoris]
MGKLHDRMEAGVDAQHIALIIPTCGRPDDLAACLRSIAGEADGSVAQVIVIDDGADELVVVPPEVGGVPVVKRRNAVRRGAAYSRNLALQVLADEVDAVGFLDDDARLTPGWLEAARRELTRARGAVTGPVLRFDRGIVSRARQLRYNDRYAPLEPGQAVPFLAGGNAMVWRDLLVKAGGFPDTRTMSDRFLVRRLEAAGGMTHFVPDMVVLHRNSKGLRVAVREAWRAGLLDDTPLTGTASERLSGGMRAAVAGEHAPAALLNVALDAVYLGGRERARRSQWRARGARVVPRASTAKR